MTSIMASKKTADDFFSWQFLFTAGPPANARAADIKIAAAADLTFAFKDVAARFEKQTGQQRQADVTARRGIFSRRFKMARRSIFSFPPTLAIRRSSRPPV